MQKYTSTQLVLLQIIPLWYQVKNLKPVKRYEADGEGGGKGKYHRERGGQPEHFVIKDDINDINNICGDLIVINFDDDGNIFKT